MLNRAARYFPIIRILHSYTDQRSEILEIGSGPYGIAEFWPRPIVGCDIEFTDRPSRFLSPLICAGGDLPFRDRHFDAVIVSDVLEHVPPGSRKRLVAEALRVTRKVAVFGYPSGEAARKCDLVLRDLYLSRHIAPPIWLQEHMQNPFPDENLWQEPFLGWGIETLPNEKLGFHSWMMRLEMHGKINAVLRKGLRTMPWVFERLLRSADGEPSYRKIFVLTREPQLNSA